MQTIIYTDRIAEALADVLASVPHDHLYILTDDNTACLCLPLAADALAGRDYRLITLRAGDEAKSVESLAAVWQELSTTGATRRSLLVNLGGGMITDLGGFAAATFKRGIRFVNVATSLLGAVDAAVGGKTGINFLTFKNEVGAFCEADAVVISTQFFRSLDRANLLSGYAEMLKHGLLSSADYFDRLLRFDIEGLAEAPSSETVSVKAPSSEVSSSKAATSKDALLAELLPLLKESVEIKREVVRQDPHEQGIRRALNLGHTVGHAFESLALQQGRPVLHGYAVAWGLVCELILSHRQCGFAKETLLATARFVRKHYGAPAITCKHYDALLELMTHDKKNDSGFINFTLLRGVGDIAINQTASREELTLMFDLFRDLMGI
jgi:3-dehydroquinate synthase